MWQKCHLYYLPHDVYNYESRNHSSWTNYKPLVTTFSQCFIWYLDNIIVWLERSIMLTIYSHGWKFTKLVETFRDRLSLLKQGISINGGKVIEGQGAASRARVLEYHVQRKSERKEIGSRRELDNHVFRAWKGSEILNNGWRMDEYWSRPCWSLISWLDPHSSINSSMSPRQIVTKFWDHVLDQFNTLTLVIWNFMYLICIIISIAIYLFIYHYCW